MAPLFLFQPHVQLLRDARAELIHLPEQRAERPQVGRQSIVFLPGGPRLLAMLRGSQQFPDSVPCAAESRPHPEPAAEPFQLPIEPSDLGLVVSR